MPSADKAYDVQKADVLFNKVNLALARSQRLLESWLPPRPEAPQESYNSLGEKIAVPDEDDIFTAEPELLGVGATAPVIEDPLSRSRATSKNLTAHARLRRQLLGSKHSQEKKTSPHKVEVRNATQRAQGRPAGGRPQQLDNRVQHTTHNAQRSYHLNPDALDVDNDDDDELSRTTAISARKPHINSNKAKNLAYKNVPSSDPPKHRLSASDHPQINPNSTSKISSPPASHPVLTPAPTNTLPKPKPAQKPLPKHTHIPIQASTPIPTPDPDPPKRQETTPPNKSKPPKTNHKPHHPDQTNKKEKNLASKDPTRARTDKADKARQKQLRKRAKREQRRRAEAADKAQRP